MTTIKQFSLAGGELSPRLHARTDQAKYQFGLRTVRNTIIMKDGGSANRPGTKFISEVKDSTKTIRFIRFVFNDSQTYVLEFGDLYMRAHREGAQLTDLSLTITGVTNANPAVLTYTGTDPSNGQEVQISGITGAISSYLNGRNFKIASVNAGANTFQLQYMNGTNVNSTSFGSYTSGGTAARVYTLTTPYVEADLPTIQFVQSADVITLVHPSYAVRELSRSGHTSWTLSTITFGTTTPAPASATASVIGGPTGTIPVQYKVTAVDSATFEESLPATSNGIDANTGDAPYGLGGLTWDSVSGASYYNIYKSHRNGSFGFIAIATTTSLTDLGYEPDYSETPPVARDPFPSGGNYPSAVTYIQQRRVFANTFNNPETVWGSRIGQFLNFNVSNPIQDDDAITFGMAGRQVNEVRHLLDLGQFMVLTSGGEFTIKGDSAGIIKPGEINPRQNSYNGASTLSPVIIGNSALYIQSRGTIIRDLAFDIQADGHQGRDLTIFATHLFEGYTIVDWAYQQNPHSIVWAVRDDGVLLGLTYVKEQEILAWHHHDFDGTVENVCVVPEGMEDVLYLCIKRTINGASKRYIERMNTRRVDNIVDSIFMDAALTYDGRNSNASHSMTLSGGTNWVYSETLTLTSSTGFFSSEDVGNAVHLSGPNGELIRFTIWTYSSSTVVTGTAHKTVPASMRGVALSTWTKAVDQLKGLWHLEGKSVSILGDGFVVASPNNGSYDLRTVSNGSVTLDKTFGVIHVGLPYISDLETLDIDTAQGETLADKKKQLGKVTLHVEKTRGVWVGPKVPTGDDPLENLVELKLRNDEEYDDPIELHTGTVDVNIMAEWNGNGRIFIRQVDPLPVSILSIAPSGYFPFR